MNPACRGASKGTEEVMGTVEQMNPACRGASKGTEEGERLNADGRPVRMNVNDEGKF